MVDQRKPNELTAETIGDFVGRTVCVSSSRQKFNGLATVKLSSQRLLWELHMVESEYVAAFPSSDIRVFEWFVPPVSKRPQTAPEPAPGRDVEVFDLGENEAARLIDAGESTVEELQDRLRNEPAPTDAVAKLREALADRAAYFRDNPGYWDSEVELGIAERVFDLLPGVLDAYERLEWLAAETRAELDEVSRSVDESYEDDLAAQERYTSDVLRARIAELEEELSLKTAQYDTLHVKRGRFLDRCAELEAKLTAQIDATHEEAAEAIRQHTRAEKAEADLAEALKRVEVAVAEIRGWRFGEVVRIPELESTLATARKENAELREELAELRSKVGKCCDACKSPANLLTTLCRGCAND